MYKLLFTLQISLFSLLFLSSCSENDYSSFCPTWLGFTYKTGSYPNYVQGKSGGIASVNAGDSLHITACQKERGRLINGTDYSWTVCYDTLDTKMNDDPSDDEIVHVQVSKYQHTNYDGYANGADDPVGHLLIPANAVKTSFKPDTVKFNAYYTYSGQGVMVETGNIVDNLSYNGRIVPQSSVAYGGAQGVFFFYVK